MSEGKRVLRQAFKDLERELPQRSSRPCRGTRAAPSQRPATSAFQWRSCPSLAGFSRSCRCSGFGCSPLGLLLSGSRRALSLKPVGRFTSWGATNGQSSQAQPI